MLSASLISFPEKAKVIHWEDEIRLSLSINYVRVCVSWKV